MTSATPMLPPVQSTTTLPGRRKLTLGREVGRGSQATVFRAVLEGEYLVRRAVAVKVLDGMLLEEIDAARSSLANAVQRAACIRHPNVVDTFEFTVLEATRQVAILSELVDGTTLHSLIENHARVERRLPLDLALFIATEIAEGLHGARMAMSAEGLRLGVAHLALSARDVLLSWNGEVKISDFGIGYTLGAVSTVRSLRSVVMRASTMAPEVARRRTGDGRSDVFSLGILLREMLVGPRFPATIGEVEAIEHAREGFIPSTFIEMQLPKEVRKIIARALEIDPAHRYPNANAMAYDLRKVALSMGVGDGRVFLRSALVKEPEAAEPPRATRSMGDRTIGDDEPTQEIHHRPRPVAERTSGLILKAMKREGSRSNE